MCNFKYSIQRITDDSMRIKVTAQMPAPESYLGKQSQHKALAKECKLLLLKSTSDFYQMLFIET